MIKNNKDLISGIKQKCLREEINHKISKDYILQKELNILAESTGISIRNAEIMALTAGIVPERYMRNINALSLPEQINLLESRVTIVGLGGLGGTVTEITARMGIGDLNLIDGDHFESHNLNRQFLSSESNIGLPKAEAAYKKVKSINSGIDTRYKTSFLTEENASALLQGSHVICDCLDTIRDRFILESAAKRLNIPIVSGAVAGFSGQALVIFPEDTGFKSVYGNRETAPAKGAEKITGTVSPAVNMIASLMCSDLVKVLLNKNLDGIRNKLRIIDLENNLYESVLLN